MFPAYSVPLILYYVFVFHNYDYIIFNDNRIIIYRILQSTSFPQKEKNTVFMRLHGCLFSPHATFEPGHLFSQNLVQNVLTTRRTEAVIFHYFSVTNYNKKNART